MSRGRGRLVVRVMAELGVIVTGVLIALWVDSLREARSEAAAQAYLISALSVEVDANLADLDAKVGGQRETLTAMRSLLALTDGGWAAAGPDSILELIAHAGSFYRVAPSFGAYDAMVASDGMRLLPTQSLGARLARFRARADRNSEEQPALGYLQRLNDVITQYGGSRAFTRPEDLERIGLPESRVSPDIAGLFADPEFEEVLFWRILLEDNITARYEADRAALGDTRKELTELAPQPGR